jgi:hypothetical protein
MESFYGFFTLLCTSLRHSKDFRSCKNTHFHWCQKNDLCVECKKKKKQNYKAYKIHSNDYWEFALEGRMEHNVLYKSNEHYRNIFLFLASSTIESDMRLWFEQKWIEHSDAGHTFYRLKIRNYEVDELLNEGIKFWEAIRIISNHYWLYNVNSALLSSIDYLDLNVRKKDTKNPTDSTSKKSELFGNFKESCGLLASNFTVNPYRRPVAGWIKERLERIAQGMKIPDLRKTYDSVQLIQSVDNVSNVLRYRNPELFPETILSRIQSSRNITSDDCLPAYLYQALDMFGYLSDTSGSPTPNDSLENLSDPSEISIINDKGFKYGKYNGISYFQNPIIHI